MSSSLGRNGNPKWQSFNGKTPMATADADPMSILADHSQSTPRRSSRHGAAGGSSNNALAAQWRVDLLELEMRLDQLRPPQPDALPPREAVDAEISAALRKGATAPDAAALALTKLALSKMAALDRLALEKSGRRSLCDEIGAGDENAAGGWRARSYLTVISALVSKGSDAAAAAAAAAQEARAEAAKEGAAAVEGFTQVGSPQCESQCSRGPRAAGESRCGCEIRGQSSVAVAQQRVAVA